MVTHTYRIHLKSTTIRLPDIDYLLGKDVEVIVREFNPASPSSNFDAVDQLLTDGASPDFFGQINDPKEWQRQIRDEWK